MWQSGLTFAWLLYSGIVIHMDNRKSVTKSVIVVQTRKATFAKKLTTTVIVNFNKKWLKGNKPFNNMSSNLETVDLMYVFQSQLYEKFLTRL